MSIALQSPSSTPHYNGHDRDSLAASRPYYQSHIATSPSGNHYLGLPPALRSDDSNSCSAQSSLSVANSRTMSKDASKPKKESFLRSVFGSKKESKAAQTTSREVYSNNPYLNPPATRRPVSSHNTGQATAGYEEPPPGYTAAPSGGSVAPPVRASTHSSIDDEYSFLSEFDTMFLIDDSGSMWGPRWREAQSALEAITPVCVERDVDGIDIEFLNASTACHNVTSASTVREAFSCVQPNGGTPMARRLEETLDVYLAKYSRNKRGTKPLNVIVVTDGQASGVEEVIETVAKELDRLKAPKRQVGIQFFQIGNDRRATWYLQKLDDNLKCDRDIVDTVPFSGVNGGHLSADGILKVVLGAVTRRLDGQSIRDIKKERLDYEQEMRAMGAYSK